MVAFIGSAACSPVLEELMKQNWDPRFFFAAWNPGLVDHLLAQQEGLKARGIERHVMVLMDDVVLDGKAADQIANLGMRGRHFNVSIMACAVSYTTLPKKFRRSLDALLVFSCPMTGDMQVLTWEFSRRASMARYALESLEEHQCLVMETLQKQQRLYTWRADHLTLELLTADQSESSPADAQTSTPPASRKVRRLPVQQEVPSAKVVADRRHPPAQRAQGVERHQELAPLVVKVAPQVLDELPLGADAGVADARAQPAVAVERAQQVHQVRLGDALHRC